MMPNSDQVKQYAAEIARNATLANPDKKALHCYLADTGKPLYWRARLKNSDTGEKWIRPFYWTGEVFQMGEPPAPPDGKWLYRLDLLALHPDAAVVIVEGENCADALNKLKVPGIIAMTSGGATSAGAANWRPLAGRVVYVWPDNDEPGARYAAEVAEKLQDIAASVSMLDVAALNLPAKGDAVDWLAAHPHATCADVMTLLTTPLLPTIATEYACTVSLIRASDIRPEPIDWLWPDWLAAGKVHILGGAPGTGKTTISLKMAATITTGGQWPDGSRAPVGNVIIWSGEDDPKDTLVPRLALAGANLERVYFVGDVLDTGDMRAFDPARDIEPLRRKLAEVGNVRLLIVDPIVSAIAGDSHKNAEVRRALQPLADLTESMRCALIGITHFSKGTGGRDPVERLTGSLAFGALARVVLVAAKHTDEGDDGRTVRLLCRAKSNIGPDDGGYEYDLTQAELEQHPGIVATSVVWGAALEGTARELLATADAAGEDGEGGTLGDAKQFLSDLLADRPLPVKTIKADADGAGYSWATIRRAQKALGIDAIKDGMKGGWMWRMPEQHTAKAIPENAKMLKDAEDAQQKEVSTFGKIEPLRGGEFDTIEVEI